MNCAKLYISCLFALVVFNTFSQERLALKFIGADSISNKTLLSKFKSYKIISFDSEEILKIIEKSSVSNPIQFPISENDSISFVVLEPNDLRDKSYKSFKTTMNGEIEVERGTVKWFKGYLNNNTNQPVRLMIDKGGVEGFFIHNDRIRFIEPLNYHVKKSSSDQFLMYYADEVMDKNMICGSAEVERYKSNFSKIASSSATNTLTNHQVKIATDADYSYHLNWKLDTNDHILGVLNQVEGLYYKDFRLTFKVTFQNVYEIDNDPYHASNATGLLSQFQNYWNTNRQNVQRNIAFLFTHTRLESGTVGIAYQSQACIDQNSSFGVFCSISSSLETIIVAHEIGHLFGASHDPDSDCNGFNPTIMCSSLSKETPFIFSELAKSSISYYINHNCFDFIQEVKIYPIPVSAYLFVECPEPDFSIVIYNSLGMQVHQSEHIGNMAHVSISTLQNGFYFAKILDSNGVMIDRRRIEITK